MSSLLTLALAVQAAPCPPATDLMELSAVHPYGQIHGLGVSADGTRAYLGEGTSVAILDLENVALAPPFDVPQPAVIARFPVDASIMELEPDGDDLWVAGGSFGVLHVDVSAAQGGGCGCDDTGSAPGCWPVTIVDDDDPDVGGTADVLDNDQWCFDVDVVTVDVQGVRTKLVAAVFGSWFDPADATTRPSELRLYLTDGTRVRRYPLPEGIAYALAVHQPVPSVNDVYIAMGPGGVVKLDLLTGLTQHGFSLDPAAPPTTPPAQPGIDRPPYNGFGFCRDVDVAGGRLYVAADDWGLLSVPVRPTDPWPPATPIQQSPLAEVFNVNAPTDSPPVSCQARVSYARHVEALELGGSTWIVVGTSNHPVYRDEGLPFVTWGRWGFRIDPGAAGKTIAGWKALYVHEQVGTELFRRATFGRPAQDGTWGPEPTNLVVQPAPPNANGETLRLFQQGQRAGLGSVDAGFEVTDFAPAATTPNPCAPGGTSPGGLTPKFAHGIVSRTPTKGVVSLQNPHVLWVNSESSQGPLSGFATIADASCPTELTELRDTFTNIGYMPTIARWRDFGDREWFVSGTNSSWILHRKHLSNLCDVEMWQIPAPVDCDGLYGREYYGNTLDRVLGYLMLSHAATQYGVLAYKTRDLQVEAVSQVPPCSELNCPQSPNPLTCLEPDLPGEPSCALQTRPLFVIDTHPEMATWTPDESLSKPDGHPNWRRTYYDSTLLVFGMEVFDATYLGGPRRMIAVAGGYRGNDVDVDGDEVVDDPDYLRGQLVIADLQQDLTNADTCAGMKVNRPVGIGLGPAESNFIWVDVVEICGSLWAFVSDFGGRIHLFDLGDLENPALTDTWDVPKVVFDAQHDNVLDLFVEQTGGQWYVTFTMPRQGLGRMRLTVDCGTGTVAFPDSALGFASPDVVRRDTPGVAHFITQRIGQCDADLGDPNNPLTNVRGLIVGDKLGGMRFYGEFEDGVPPASCPP